LVVDQIFPTLGSFPRQYHAPRLCRETAGDFSGGQPWWVCPILGFERVFFFSGASTILYRAACLGGRSWPAKSTGELISSGSLGAAYSCDGQGNKDASGRWRARQSLKGRPPGLDEGPPTLNPARASSRIVKLEAGNSAPFF